MSHWKTKYLSKIKGLRSISTYMFLNLLSLYLHFQILNMIDGKYSVRDVLLDLRPLILDRYSQHSLHTLF